MDTVRSIDIADTNRRAAIRFANRAFLWEFCEPGREIAADPGYMADRSLTSSRYWAMVDGAGKVIGVTGICDVEGEDPGNCYLGYFILDKSCRSKGLGKQLLAFTEEQARLSGKRRMRVLTSTFIPYRGGRALYCRSGYKIIATKNRHLEWHVRRSVVLPESVRRAVSDQYNWYLRLGFTATFRKKAGGLFPRPVNRMLLFEKELN
jgi:GNAT superfamily N-acetyltransferase